MWVLFMPHSPKKNIRTLQHCANNGVRRRKTQKSSHSKYYGKELLPELLTFQVLRRNSWVHVPLVSRPCIGRQHKWTKMYSLFLVITQSGNNLMLPLHTLCEFFVCFTNWINNAIEEKITWQKQGRKKGEIIDTESHLILSVKFQHWGFAGNLKKNPRHWFGTCFYNLCSTPMVFQWVAFQIINTFFKLYCLQIGKNYSLIGLKKSV